ncbi:MAG: hypothetical protein K2H40_00330, partial [Lachnospiraceae bacterium]|nr:hypothetical protein [Lachnospiraceae bacterium]
MGEHLLLYDLYQFSRRAGRYIVPLKARFRSTTDNLQSKFSIKQAADAKLVRNLAKHRRFSRAFAGT